MDLLNVAAPVCSLGCLKIKGFYNMSTNPVHRIHKEKIVKYTKRALKEKTGLLKLLLMFELVGNSNLTWRTLFCARWTIHRCLWLHQFSGSCRCWFHRISPSSPANRCIIIICIDSTFWHKTHWSSYTGTGGTRTWGTSSSTRIRTQVIWRGWQILVATGYLTWFRSSIPILIP